MRCDDDYKKKKYEKKNKVKMKGKGGKCAVKIVQGCFYFIFFFANGVREGKVFL